MSLCNVKDTVIEEHSRILSWFTFLGGVAFIFWSVVASYFEKVHFEIWPIRIGIGLALILTGSLFIRRGVSLSLTEWWITIWGLVASAYVFFVSLQHGLHPAWVTGCALVIIGILNYLTYLPQAIVFAGGSFLLSFTTFLAPLGTVNTNPWTIVLNFATAVFLGGLASYLRNSKLRRLIEMASVQDTIWTTLQDGVIMHGTDGKILALNPSAPKILGLSSDQILGRSNIDPIWKTYHIDGQPCLPEDHPSAIAQARGVIVSDFPMKLVKADGSISWLSITAVPRFETDQERPVAVIVSIKDVTAQRVQSEMIQKQQQSLEVAGRLSSLGEMAAGIAHEINNPLAVITMRSETLKYLIKRTPIPSTEIGASLDVIIKTTFKIAGIVKSMKNLSRQSQQDGFRFEELQTIISDVLTVSRDRIHHQGIELKVDEIPKMRFECHPGQIAQALLNLLNNAVDAIENQESPWIKISFVTKESEIAISVTDSGFGIPLDIRNKIFQPFFTTKVIGKGTGLGLSLVQSIAEHHNGKLSLEEGSQHTCFSLIIPLAQKDLNSEAA